MTKLFSIYLIGHIVFPAKATTRKDALREARLLAKKTGWKFDAVREFIDLQNPPSTVKVFKSDSQKTVS